MGDHSSAKNQGRRNTELSDIIFEAPLLNVSCHNFCYFLLYFACSMLYF